MYKEAINAFNKAQEELALLQREYQQKANEILCLSKQYEQKANEIIRLCAEAKKEIYKEMEFISDELEKCNQK